jgi:hypothetical protein
LIACSWRRLVICYIGDGIGPLPLVMVDSFTLLSRFILLSSVIRLDSVVVVAAANDAAASVNSTAGLLLSLKTGGEVAGEG